jgi:hypothetical protein
VGVKVGDSVLSMFVGDAVGGPVVPAVGVDEIDVVGESVGDEVGDSVGLRRSCGMIGAMEGTRLGLSDGLRVGCSVVGIAVGTSVDTVLEVVSVGVWLDNFDGTEYFDSDGPKLWVITGLSDGPRVGCNVVGKGVGSRVGTVLDVSVGVWLNDSDGMEDFDSDGIRLLMIVGLSDRPRVGCIVVGRGARFPVGTVLEVSVGVWLGDTEGHVEGEIVFGAVGDDEGFIVVGICVGSSVGFTLRVKEGAEDGYIVFSSRPNCSSLLSRNESSLFKEACETGPFPPSVTRNVRFPDPDPIKMLDPSPRSSLTLNRPVHHRQQ